MKPSNGFTEETAMETVVLNGRKMRSREQAHLYLKEKLAFPEYYGKNLDALWDMLTQLGEIQLCIKHSGTMLADLQGYGVQLLQTFYEAAAENERLQVRVIS